MRLHFRYISTYYHFNEILTEEVCDELHDAEAGNRFTLAHQEDGSFLIGGTGRNAKGDYVILTFPNKDNLVLYRGDETELAYDEFFDSMGDNNHNVYEGTVVLE